MLELIGASLVTMLATGLGAVPVFFLGTRATGLRPFLLGLAAGVMAVASIAGLLLPGLDEGTLLEVGAGLALGVLFLFVARLVLERRGNSARRAWTSGFRTSVLVFAVLLVHSLPEGFAIGTAYASTTEGLALFVVVAIAVQNIPEGTSVAIPMAADGQSRGAQFWAAVLSSAPQPVGAVVAYLLVDYVDALLPFSFGFAAGAMLALVLLELLPQSLRARPMAALAGIGAGSGAMLALSALLGV